MTAPVTTTTACPPAAHPDRATIAIRDATEADVPVVRAIYAHHLLTGTGTFDENPPGTDDMLLARARIVAQGLPYLVAECTGHPGLAGFAYVAPFRPRSAYRYTVEDSVYVAPGLEGRGIGRTLLRSLIDRSTVLGYRQMVAVVGDSRNIASISLHEALGFSRAGILRDVGYKFGQWVDVVFLQRPLGDADGPAPPPHAPLR